MPRRFRARKAREMRAFLVAQNYYLEIHHGDDDIYVKKGCGFPVKIPSRNNDEIPDGTMDNNLKMIRLCGINKKDVLRWWIDNNYGD